MVHPIDPRLAARIGSDACAGLHAAHELVSDEGEPLRVVHRDVTPHNLLISMDGHVKVTDFGVAKAYGQAQTSRVGVIKGKLAYAAPENQGEGHVDLRCDVYSMGCTLYQLLTGRRPFDATHEAELLTRILTGSYAPLNKVVPGLSPKLCAIVNKALAREPTGALSDGRTDAPCTRRMACRLGADCPPLSGRRRPARPPGPDRSRTQRGDTSSLGEVSTAIAWRRIFPLLRPAASLPGPPWATDLDPLAQPGLAVFVEQLGPPAASPSSAQVPAPPAYLAASVGDTIDMLVYGVDTRDDTTLQYPWRLRMPRDDQLSG